MYEGRQPHSGWTVHLMRDSGHNPDAQGPPCRPHAVAPVNADCGQLVKAGSDALPDAYARLRPRWEYGHVAAFAAWFAGYVLLQVSVLRSADRVSPAT